MFQLVSFLGKNDSNALTILSTKMVNDLLNYKVHDQKGKQPTEL